MNSDTNEILQNLIGSELSRCQRDPSLLDEKLKQDLEKWRQESQDVNVLDAACLVYPKVYDSLPSLTEHELSSRKRTLDFLLDKIDYPEWAAQVEFTQAGDAEYADRLMYFRRYQTFLLKMICCFLNNSPKLWAHVGNKALYKLGSLAHSHLEFDSDLMLVSSREKCIQLVCDITKSDNITVVINHHVSSEEILKDMIADGVEFKQAWKKSFGTRFAITWIVCHFDFQHLNDYFVYILQYVLHFLDDHELSSKICGIRIIQHVLHQWPKLDKRYFSLTDLFFEKLSAQFAFRESNVLSILYPCTRDFLIQTAFDSVKHFDRIEKILQILLRESSYEDKVDLKRIYIVQLPLFVDLYGILSVKYLKNILQIYTDYIERSELSVKLLALDALEKLVKLSSIRIIAYRHSLLARLKDFQSLNETDPIFIQRCSEMIVALESL